MESAQLYRALLEPFKDAKAVSGYCPNLVPLHFLTYILAGESDKLPNVSHVMRTIDMIAEQGTIARSAHIEYGGQSLLISQCSLSFPARRDQRKETSTECVTLTHLREGKKMTELSVLEDAMDPKTATVGGNWHTVTQSHIIVLPDGTISVTYSFPAQTTYRNPENTLPPFADVGTVSMCYQPHPSLPEISPYGNSIGKIKKDIQASIDAACAERLFSTENQPPLYLSKRPHSSSKKTNTLSALVLHAMNSYSKCLADPGKYTEVPQGTRLQ